MPTIVHGELRRAKWPGIIEFAEFQKYSKLHGKLLGSSITSGYERPWEQRQGTAVQKWSCREFLAKFAPDPLSSWLGRDHKSVDMRTLVGGNSPSPWDRKTCATALLLLQERL